MGKKKGNSKEAWLDWLRDEPPPQSAQDELRERFKRQANSYQPVNRAQPGPAAAPVSPVAAPEAAPQPQAVSHTTPTPEKAPEASKTAAPATVSIQIHIPSLQSERFRKLAAKPKQGITAVKHWFSGQLRTNKARTIGISIGVPVVVLLLLVPPLFNFGHGKDKTDGGSAAGGAAGATVKYEKPPFEIVRPSNKPKLATPDGVHAAYDGAKNTYSYSDSIGSNGFTVSQQPIPPQFADGQAAVDSIAPTLTKGVTPVTLNILTGSAAVSTNPKYNSQIVVVAVRDQLLFIQSSHTFKDTEWENYLNTLQ
jgi:hypothetical protein